MFRMTRPDLAPESAPRLAREAMCLALFFGSADHRFRQDPFLGVDCTMNVAVCEQSGHFALFDFECLLDIAPYAPSEFINFCFLGLSARNPIFLVDDSGLPLDEGLFDFIHDYFHEDAEFVRLLEDVFEHYSGDGGERFFHAIVLEAFGRDTVPEKTVREAYGRLMRMLEHILGLVREKLFLPSFFAQVPDGL
jgi:hypothetical protein